MRLQIADISYPGWIEAQSLERVGLEDAKCQQGEQTARDEIEENALDVERKALVTSVLEIADPEGRR